MAFPRFFWCPLLEPLSSSELSPDVSILLSSFNVLRDICIFEWGRPASSFTLLITGTSMMAARFSITVGLWFRQQAFWQRLYPNLTFLLIHPFDLAFRSSTHSGRHSSIFFVTLHEQQSQLNQNLAPHRSLCKDMHNTVWFLESLPVMYQKCVQTTLLDNMDKGFLHQKGRLALLFLPLRTCIRCLSLPQQYLRRNS